jgi:hypothetical protein
MAWGRIAAVASLLLVLAACGHRSSGSVEGTPGATTAVVGSAATKTPVDQIVVTENDITDRRYVSLGDLSVEVAKWNIFEKDPTREQVNQALREQAAKLGADAVVLVRYGTVNITVWSWGALGGNGRAVAFEK